MTDAANQGVNMIRKISAVALAALIGAFVLTQPTQIRAGSKFDGAWSLVVMTRTGPCDAAYRFSGQIVNGVILYSGSGLDFTGRVRPSGSALLRVSSGSNYAVAHGRLTVRSGSGTWRGQTPNGYCTGTWRATRA